MKNCYKFDCFILRLMPNQYNLMESNPKLKSVCVRLILLTEFKYLAKFASEQIWTCAICCSRCCDIFSQVLVRQAENWSETCSKHRQAIKPFGWSACNLILFPERNSTQKENEESPKRAKQKAWSRSMKKVLTLNYSN